MCDIETFDHLNFKATDVKCLAYDGDSRTLRIIQDENDSCLLKEDREYIYFNTGQYACKFNVNDVSKRCTITRVSTKIPVNDLYLEDTMKFNLWESWYEDFVLPGKTEIIHKSTLVRSVSYGEWNEDLHITEFKKPRQILSFAKEIRPSYKFDIQIAYDLTPETLATLPIIYRLLKQNLDRSYMIFMPDVDWVNWKRTGGIQGDLTNYDQFKMDIPKDYNWMVYSKTKPNMVYFVKTHVDACALLADLKFRGRIPFVTCGVALFEDYYFMPLMYNKIHIDCWSKKVTLSEPREHILNLQKELIKMF